MLVRKGKTRFEKKNTYKTYPKMLPMLKPPKTTATALERSSKGIVLYMVDTRDKKFKAT